MHASKSELLCLICIFLHLRFLFESLRPWDPLNDIAQYEKDGRLQTMQRNLSNRMSAHKNMCISSQVGRHKVTSPLLDFYFCAGPQCFPLWFGQVFPALVLAEWWLAKSQIWACMIRCLSGQSVPSTFWPGFEGMWTHHDYNNPVKWLGNDPLSDLKDFWAETFLCGFPRENFSSYMKSVWFPAKL